MSRSAWEFVLTVDGCPYAFGTGGLTSLPTPTVPSDGASYASDWCSAWTLITGGLKAPMVSWSETILPFEGDVEVSGLSFWLYDAVATSGVASGSRVVTYLTTRDVADFTQQLLSSAIDDNDLSIVMDAAGAFGAGSQVVYIEREAILCDSRSSATLTVNASGRGYYGSRAVSHLVDADNIYYPKVLGSFPGFTRRRVILWVVVSGTAFPVWRGIVSRAPRLGEDGLTYELQCEHVWTVEREERLGQTPATANVRGINSTAIWARVSAYSSTESYYESTTPSGVEFPVYPTYLEALKLGVEKTLTDVISTAGHASAYQFTLSLDDGGTRFWARSEGAGALKISLTVGSQTASEAAGQTADPRSVAVTVPGVPDVLVILRSYYTSEKLPLTRVRGFSASWSSNPYTDGTFTTTVQPVLLANYGNDQLIVFSPTSTSSNDTALAGGGPSATGSVELVSRASGRRSVDVPAYQFAAPRGNPGGTGSRNGEDVTILIDGPTTVRQGLSIRCDHLVYGFKNGLFNTFSWVPFIDTRNWNWSSSRIDSCAADTSGVGTSRTWFLDGTQKASELICDNLKVHAIALTVRGSRLMPVAMVVPNASVSSVATLTTANYLAPPKWGEFPDGLANALDISTPNGNKILVRDQESIALYGQSRAIEADLSGIDDPALQAASPVEIGLSALGRLTGLWRHPPRQVTLVVSLVSYGVTIFAGDYVTFSDWLTPAGDGTRGAVSVLGQVRGRTVDIEAGTLTLEVLVYRISRIAGYAPCVRVASRTGAVLTVATAYLTAIGTEGRTATDYAGSNLTWYSGTSNDGGTSRFAAGDKVRLITRNSTTLTTEGGLVVQSVNAVAKTITLTTTPTTVISAATDFIDLIYDDYSTSSPTTTQKAYAWVADGTPPVIDGTSDKAKVWAP